MKTAHEPYTIKDRLKDAIECADALDLPDGAYWALVHEMAGLEYGDAFQIIGGDPAFFGYTITTDD